MAKRSGPEFLVNTTVANQQSFSDATGLTNGRFVVTWVDVSATAPDTSGLATRAQIFNANGSRFGAEFVVNTTTANQQADGHVTWLATGGFVVTWQDTNPGGGDTSVAAIRAQVFDWAGTKLGGEVLVNTTTLRGQSEPAITTLTDGRFVVTWTDESILGGPFPDQNIRGQIFNADGSTFGSEFIVNTDQNFAQYESDVAALQNGGFVVTWTDFSGRPDDAIDTALRMRVFSANGTPASGEILVNTITFGVQELPQVTGLANGRFVVTWTDRSQSPDDVSTKAVRGQVFNDNGSKFGAEFLIPTIVTADQYDSVITALPDGRFVVAWTDESDSADDNSGNAVRAQVFNANGSRAGAEFLVNTTTVGAQFDPAVAALADGRFVVSWTDFSLTDPDRSDFGIRAQIFDARTAAITLNGTAVSDDYLGTKFDDILKGAGGQDILKGGSGADTLNGGAGNDRLQGGLGRDFLTGGTGADRFIFASAAEAGNGLTRDLIKDFSSGLDKIVLSGFLPGGQFIGSQGFGAAGDVRYNAGTEMLAGDVDGDGITDFQIRLVGDAPVAGDFIF